MEFVVTLLFLATVWFAIRISSISRELNDAQDRLAALEDRFRRFRTEPRPTVLPSEERRPEAEAGLAGRLRETRDKAREGENAGPPAGAEAPAAPPAEAPEPATGSPAAPPPIPPELVAATVAAPIPARAEIPEIPVGDSRVAPEPLRPITAEDFDLEPPLAAFAASSPNPVERDLSFEARVGTVWANRLGLVVLIVGFGFLSRVVSPHVGPGAKTSLAYLVGLAMIAVGRHYGERLKVFARPLTAGGLALGFFAAWGAGFAGPMRCVPVAVSLVWMLAQCGAMFYVADRWKSQLTAAFAIFLGHVAALVGGAGVGDEAGVGPYSLVVVVFLAGAAVAMFLKNRWPPLSFLGVAASYLSHGVWTTLDHPDAPPEAGFWVNLVFLTSYYLIFALSDLVWRVRYASNESGLSPRDRLAVRATAPANLIAYVSLASIGFFATDVYEDRIHWFFFAVGAVQVALSFVHRRAGNRDHALYLGVAATLATLGLFGAYGGRGDVTLNLILAAEAFMLLVAAHRTRLWIFHALAQAVLATNFVHFWILQGGEGGRTIGALYGGALVAGVYFLKATLEEIWYGGDSPGLEWGGEGSDGSFGRVLKRGFDELFRPIAPLLPHLHAAGGATILVRTLSEAPLGSLHEILPLGAATIALAALAAWRRSAALLTGMVALQFFALGAAPRTTGDNTAVGFPVEAWWFSASGWIASALAAATARSLFAVAGREGPARIASRLAMWIATVAAILGLRGIDAGNHAFALVWIATIALVYVREALDGDRATAPPDFGAGFRARALPEARAVHAVAASGAAALLVGMAVHREFGGGAEAIPALAAWGAVALVAAILARRAEFAVGTALLVLAAHLRYYALFLDRTDGGEPLAWIALATSGITFAFGLLGDRFAPAPAAADGRDLRPIDLGVLALQAGAVAMASHYGYRAIAFPWSVAGIAAGALGLALLGRFAPFPRARLAAIGTACFAFLVYLLGLTDDGIPDADARSLLPIVVAYVVALLAERARRGAGEEDAGSAAVVLVATAATMIAAWRSTLAGPNGAAATALWALLGVGLMLAGFVAASAIRRRVALGVLTICVARVFLVDTREFGDVEKTIAFMTLGACLIGVAWIYARFGERIRKWL